VSTNKKVDLETFLVKWTTVYVTASIWQVFVCTLWGIKNVAVNILQQLLQILTDFDNFCIKLTRNE